MEIPDILKILFVEDLAADQQLAEHQLRIGGITFVSKRVEDEVSFWSALEEFQPDLVISDYSMPTFGGMEALQLSLGHNPDIPVIILTDSMNEQTAVQCLRAGAADFVIKEHMMRLPFAVRDALERSSGRISVRVSQKKFEEQEQELSAIFENSPILMILVDDQVKIRKINGVSVGPEFPDSSSTLGLRFGDAIRCINALALPGGCGTGAACQSCQLRNLILETFRTGEPSQQMDVRISLMHDGSPYHIDFLLSTSKLKINEKEMVLVSLLDITAKKKADEQLLQERSLMRTLIDSLPDRVFFKDLNSKFIVANQGVARHIGVDSPDQLIGKSDFDFYPGEHAAEYFRDEQELLKSGLALINHEEPARDSTGTIGWTQTSKIPVRDSDGKVFGLVGISRDISEFKRIHQDLINAKELAEQSTNLKDAFIANISHEIRTPLNAILGFTDLIKDTLSEHISEETASYFDIVENSCQRLLRTVGMILHISRLQIGEIKLNPTRIDLSLLTNNLVKEYSLPAEKKSLELVYLNECRDGTIFSDEYYLTHSISNLIENAIKYTNKGFISVHLSDIHDGGILLEVQDSGIGISPEFMNHLFDPFSQEEIGYTRSFEGIGLGLSITHGFLHAIGARMDAESEKGKGSYLRVTFPRSIPELRV